MAPRGKRGRGRGRPDGSHGPPPPHPAPPVPRPAGAARFTPAATYLGHHAPPAPLGGQAHAQPPLGVPPAPQHVLEGVLAGLQPYPAPPPAYPAPPALPLHAQSYAGQRPPPAAYYGATPPRVPGPSRAAWPPPPVQHPVPERTAYSRTPSVPSMNFDSAPSSARSTPPAVYPPPPQPQAYTRAPVPPVEHYTAPSPAPYRVPPPPAPYVAPPAAAPPAVIAPHPVSPAAPTRIASPAAAVLPPAAVTASPAPRPVPSRAPATPAPPPPAPASAPAAPTSPAPLSALPAALRAQGTATPISAAHDFVPLPPPSSAVKPAAGSSESESDSSSSSSSSSSSEDGSSEDEDSDSDDEERVASALVGPRRSGESSAPPAPPAKSAGSSSSASSSSSSSDSSSDDDSDAESFAGAAAPERGRDDDDGAESDAISNLEEAVQEMVDDEDDDEHALHAAELPFDLGSASEADAGADDDDAPDDSLEHAARRKRRRVDSAGLGSTTAPPEDEDDRASSRAVSLDPATQGDESDDAPSPRKRARLSPSLPPSPTLAAASTAPQEAPALPPRAPALAGHAFSTSTPSRLSSVHTAPAPSSPVANESDLLLHPMQDEDDELEEGELPVEKEEAAPPAHHPSLPLAPAAASASAFYSPALVAARPGSAPSALPYPVAGYAHHHPALPIGGAAGQVQLAVPGRAGEITVSGVGYGAGAGDVADQSMDMEMSFADLPAELLADLSRRAAGAISIAVPPPPAGASKATYERRAGGPPKVDLSSTPVASGSGQGIVVHGKPAKLSYKPSPLAQPPVALLDPSAPAPVPSKGVYVRRQPVATVSTDTTPSATPAPVAAPPPAKAVYERPANAPSGKGAKQRSKATKPGKPAGQLPLSQEEKAERLPHKLYKAFGDFPSLEAAADPSIFAVPHHTVLPGRNLPPPNELCTHGFWPGPPALKLGKAIFPAPPEPLEDAADDPRPRVDVFVDNSNVVYSFLNWVRARPEAKILNKVQPVGGAAGKGKDGAMGKTKTVKTVTIGGKKVRIDYRVLFALLERGRKIERRVLAGSSTLWQTLEPAVEWGYEISLMQRVPRSEPSTSAATIAQVAQAAAANAASSKKRGKNGKLKKPPAPPPPVIVQPQASGVKHYKEQAVDELVHLKILETLLDYTPSPLPPPSPPRRAAALPPAPAPAAPVAPSTPADELVETQSETAPSRAESAVPESAPAPAAESSAAAVPADGEEPAAAEGDGADEPGELSAEPVAPPAPIAGEDAPVEVSAEDAAVAPAEPSVEPVAPLGMAAVDGALANAPAAEDVEMGEVAEEGEEVETAPLQSEPGAEEQDGAAHNAEPSERAGAQAADADEASADADAPPADAAPPAGAGAAAASAGESGEAVAAPADDACAVEPAADSSASTPASEPAKSRFLPSKAFLSGSVQPAKPVAAVATAPKPASGPSKFTPAAPKPKIAPVITPAKPAAPPKPAFAPRIPPSDRPTLVIVTGDANSSEYNPGGFLGCVRRALDRGWDVEVVAFTHGISSLWTGEQQIKVTSDGRRRGELRVIDLAQFGEELVL
ncbi:hypothetical protein JCM10449v2_002810 [Rhodotorula kratochvilovae]